MAGEQRVIESEKRVDGRALASFGIVLALIVSACSSRPHRAPVEERAGVPRAGLVRPPAPAASSVVPADPAASAAAASDAVARPGYYTVKPGDTLIRIALDYGQNWKDLVKWNELENPNVIEVGQALRVVAPGADPTQAMARAVSAPRVETRGLATVPAPVALGAPTPLSGTAAAPLPGTATTTAAAASAPVFVMPSPSSTTTTTATAAAAAAQPAARDGDDDVRWAWPADGSVIRSFEESKVKGLVIGGKPGDPVHAAADGRVVYAGSGLRGYGNLVILKHNTTYLTAYAHNQTLLVKEDQNVRRGQKIAEMGSTDAEGVRLHFEIRKQGKPIDPSKLLPPR